MERKGPLWLSGTAFAEVCWQKECEAQLENFKYLVWFRICGGGASGMEGQGICDNECGSLYLFECETRVCRVYSVDILYLCKGSFATMKKQESWNRTTETRNKSLSMRL